MQKERNSFFGHVMRSDMKDRNVSAVLTLTVAVLAIIVVWISSPAFANRHLATTHNECGADHIDIQLTVGTIRVLNGQSARFRPPSDRWVWRCDGSRKWSRCVGADFVQVFKSKGGKLRWDCFSVSYGYLQQARRPVVSISLPQNRFDKRIVGIADNSMQQAGNGLPPIGVQSLS